MQKASKRSKTTLGKRKLGSVMKNNLHPFDQVTMERVQMSHPRFLKNLDIAKLRRNIQNQRAAVNIENAKAHIGPEAS